MTKEGLRERLDSLSSQSPLADLQQYVNSMIEVRGFADETLKDLMIFMMAEIGELAEEVCKLSNMKIDVSKDSTAHIADELADVFIFLLSICRNLNIDLFEAFKEKEEKNCSRNWK